MRYRKAVFVVVYSKTEKEIEYLILKRKLHWNGWEFPKGGLEGLKEIIFTKNAVKRELREETGLNPIKIIKFSVKGRYKYNKQLKDRPGIIGQEFILYAAEVKKQKIKIDALEHSDYKWALFKEALKKLTWQNQKKCLKIVNSYLKHGI